MSEISLEQGKCPRLEIVIPFDTERDAEIAYNSLRVDREPKRSQVVKTISVSGEKLILTLVAPDPRSLRLSSNTFFDHLILVRKTIENFSLDKFDKERSGYGDIKRPCLASDIRS